MWCYRDKCSGKMMFAVILTCIIVVIFYSLQPSQKHQDGLQLKSMLGELQQVSSLLRGIGQTKSKYNNNNKIPAVNDDNFVGLEMTDPRLIAYVKNQMSSPSSKPYNLSQPTRVHFSQYDQSQFAENNFLHGMGGGFFIEVGALDGEDKSNSLYFEKYRGWTGLLIEPNPMLYATLSSLHRKSYSIRTGLSFSNKADKAKFKASRGGSKVTARGSLTIKMIPLYTLLLALNVTQVDYFSLDIEGSEMKVLQTIPWDKIRFRLIDIEINHVPGGTKGMINYLEPLGYTYLGNRNIDAWFGCKDLLKQTMDVDKYLKENDIQAKRQKILNN